MQTLVAQILDGDEKAVEQLYKEYAPKILHYLQSKLAQDDAIEILNDVFLDAIDALPTIRQHKSLRAFLYSIAHNKMVNFYRKKKIKSVLMSKIPLLAILAKEILEPEFQLEKNELRDKIEETMHVISEKYRKILHMHYEDDLPVKQIAGILGITPKAAESLLYRARRQFMKTYERA